MAHGDEDLQQELILWVIEHLVFKEDIEEEYIPQRMQIHIKAYKRSFLMVNGLGKSVDYGDPTGRKQNYLIVDYDGMDEYCGNDIIAGELEKMFPRQPNTEKEALFQVDYERFLETLTEQERTYLEKKLEGCTWTEMKKDLPAWKQQYLKTRIKEKLKAYFSEW